MTLAKINRTIFGKEMPDKLKQCFIVLIQKNPILQQADKDFVCDYIHNFESISDEHRIEVFDIIDSMELFEYNV